MANVRRVPPSLVQRFVGDVRVVVRRATSPPPNEFDAHVDEAVRLASATRVVLVVLVGDGAEAIFDAQQRVKLSRAGLFAHPTAILAPAVRPEPVTSETWLGATIRPFGPGELEKACDFLEIPGSQRSAVRAAIESMKSEIAGGPPDA